jgi:3-methylcrotonyl-CoA carboxylase alpha subunit
VEQRFIVNAELLVLRADRSGDNVRVHVNGEVVEVDDYAIDDRYITVRRGDKTSRYLYARDGRHIHIAVNGRSVEFIPAEEEAETAATGPGFTPEILAPMPGKVLDVLVAAGDRVDAGTPLVLLEAMKMEQTVRSPADARVVQVKVKTDQMVGPGQILVVLEPVDTEA